MKNRIAIISKRLITILVVHVIAISGVFAQRSFELSLGSISGASQNIGAGIAEPGKIYLELLVDRAARVPTGAGWQYAVAYQITLQGSTTVLNSGTLSLFANTKYKVRDYIVFTSSASLYTVTVTSVTPAGSPPASIRLRAAYVSGTTAVLNLATVPSLTKGTKKLFWNPIPGAASYELEWVYVDSRQTFAGDPFVVFTPVRAIVDATDYPYVTNLPSGKIYYRVRAVTSYLDANGEPTTVLKGAWSATRDVTQITSFEQNKNWQTVTLLAEDGKRKDMITYYDGAYRERQSLSTINTDSSAVVEDSKYDYDGREAISILATPVQGSSIQFQDRHNKYHGSAYSAAHFKPGNVLPMDSSSGTSRYYSSNNNTGGINRDYIATAGGYPFSVRQYKSDPTSRVVRASGVGSNLKFGSTHETFYTYGDVAGIELSRLFGTNTGQSKYYKKELKRDPNGQYNVTYLDQLDRIVATASTGTYDGQTLDVIYPGDPAPLLSVDLMESNEVDVANTKSVSVKKLLNTVSTAYTFKYNLSSLTYTEAVAQFGTSFCATCRYQLTIRILDPDQNIVNLNYGGSPIVSRIIQPSALPQCNAPTEPYTEPEIKFSVTLGLPGEYTIIKELVLTDGVINTTVEAQIQSNTPGKITVERGIQAGKVNKKICDRNCQAFCDDAPATCDQLCKQRTTAMINQLLADECTAMMEQLKADFRKPGGWIYQDKATLAYYAKTYLDPTVTIGNVDQKYDDSWPGALYIRHPEYALARKCTELTDSRTFDLDFSSTMTLAEATTKGYTIPVVPHPANCVDPYFNNVLWGAHRVPPSPTRTYRDDMIKRLNEYFTDRNGTVYSAWEFVANKELVLGVDPINLDMLCRKFPFDISGNTVPKDLQWLLFKGIYLSIKAEIHKRILNDIYHIQYFDNPNAHIQGPYPSNTAQAQAIASTTSSSFCASLCQVRADSWIYQLRQNCTIADDIVPTLKNFFITYCNGQCSAGNVLVPLTASAVASDYSLQQIQTLIGSCNLSDVAVPNDKATYKEICNQVCAPVCVEPVLDMIFSGVGEWSDIDDNLKRCLDTVKLPFDRIRRTQTGITTVKRGSNEKVCDIIFTDNEGRPISWSNIARKISSESTTILPKLRIPAGYTFLETSVMIQLRNGSTVRAFVFASCKWPRRCEVGRIPDSRSSDLLSLIGQWVANRRVSNPQDALYSITGRSKDLIDVCVKVYDASLDKKFREYKCDSCKVAIVMANGNVIPAKGLTSFVVGKYDRSAPAPSVRGMSYSGLAVTVSTAIYPPFKAYLYTSCKFGWQKDCHTVPGCTNVALDSLPSPKQHCEKQIDREIDYRTNVNVGKDQEKFRTDRLDIYRNRCFRDRTETFVVEFQKREYHYTLYYFDLAGNLVQTVPPKGVAIGNGTADPAHKMQSVQGYNSRNQVTTKVTPDEGTIAYWYNKAGLPRFSQDAEQKLRGAFSYTKYDARRRVIEVGEVTTTEASITTGLENPTYPNPALFVLTQIVKTYYDREESALCPGLTGVNNLRGRVSATVSMSDEVTSVCITCFSYDVQGQVRTMLQNIVGLGVKRFVYDYDVVTGRLNSVTYQPGQFDQFIQRFSFDADNRQVSASSSRDGFIWDNDVRYFYYKHGPLARMEIGEDSVQARDYAYTVQGWLKAVNSNTLNSSRDPGHDGASANLFTAPDVFGYSLGYHAGDYKPINTAVSGTNGPEARYAGSGFASDGVNLYSGNISQMVKAINGLTTTGESYRYDQLYRLKAVAVNSDLNAVTNTWGSSTADEDYKSTYTYDDNSNILKLTRNASGNSTSRKMDEMVFNYNPINNQLLHVRDLQSPTRYSYDFDSPNTFNSGNQSANLFSYDARGRLVRDESAGIAEIQWNVYGRVARVNKKAGEGPHLKFQYDGSHQRMAKMKMPEATVNDETTWTKLFYVRDAKGEVLATYESLNGAVTLKDFSIYGTRRIGVWNINQPLTAGLPPNSLIRGDKEYELTDHLDNVIATISDVSLGVDTDGNGRVDSYAAQVLTSRDYYPYGMPMVRPGMTFGSYRYGFNAGSEIDDISASQVGRFFSTEFRGNDTYLARWWSTDPETAQTPFESPYVSMGGSPIQNNDPKGDILETAWDVVSLVTGVYSLVQNVREGNAGAACVDAVGVLLDAAAVVTPLVPGGVGAALKVTRGGAKAAEALKDAKHAADALEAVNEANHIADAVKGGSKAIEAAEKGKDIAKAVESGKEAVKAGEKAADVGKAAEKSAELQKAEQRAAKLSERQRPGQPVTRAGKEATKDLNKAKNGGKMKCETCGIEVKDATQHTRGKTPPPDEAHVDHIYPRSKGGSGTPDNTDVKCRTCNLEKSDKTP